MEVHDSTGQLRIHGTADLKLALIVRRPLELAAFSSLFRQLPGVSLVVAESHMAEGVDECLLLRPKAVILDATYPGFASFKAAQRLAESGRIQRIAFLDNALAVCRASRALSVPGAIYFTRDDHPQEVIEYLRLDATKRRAAIARQFSSPTLIANEFRLRQLDEAGVLRLSRCEQTVLSHLASGQPLREIAKALDRADSTIENHKSRLMKKLGVHRSVDLANLAIRTGLVE
jgi:DNA-binding NarL/FixJ family response regulator